jgi:hypothetical protein
MCGPVILWGDGPTNIRCFFIGPTDGPTRLGPEQRPDHEHDDRRRHPEGVEDPPQGALFTVARNSLASFFRCLETPPSPLLWPPKIPAGASRAPARSGSPSLDRPILGDPNTRPGRRGPRLFPPSLMPSCTRQHAIRRGCHPGAKLHPSKSPLSGWWAAWA